MIVRKPTVWVFVMSEHFAFACNRNRRAFWKILAFKGPSAIRPVETRQIYTLGHKATSSAETQTDA